MSFSQLTEAEVATIDGLQKKRATPGKILRIVQASRLRKGEIGPGKTAVYDFLSGRTHKRSVAEKRGRISKVPPGILTVATTERRRLIKAAKNEFLVTWSDIHKATHSVLKKRNSLRGGRKMPSSDWLQRAMRSKMDVRARPAKRRISRKECDAAKRLIKAKQWAKYPRIWWKTGIHCYLDSKKWVRANKASDKKLLRATRLHHHLRTPSEGKEKPFVLPKRNHMLLGVPSVHVTAAVTGDRIIFWHITEGPWNGQAAAAMYHELGEALRKHYGNLGFFRVVEDGDTKGFQSDRGKEAKAAERIHSWTLAPRSPGWMPLDYSIWDEIEDRVLSKRAPPDESAANYVKRLRYAAFHLPRSYISRTVLKMKDNITATVQSGGEHTKALLE